jgi:uncharacterized membrane protein YuzA (DUF378 family)
MLKGGSSWYHASWILVVVGALNWGLVGLFDFNLVHAILGGVPALERIVYILVGVAGIVMIATCKHHCASGVKKKK